MTEDITKKPGELALNLSQVKEGDEVVVVKVAGNSALRRRLLEMGLVKGAVLKVEKYAPLRDPLELILKGMHLSLRVEEAKNVIIEKQ